MKHLPSNSFYSQNFTGSLAIAALDHLLILSREQLSPSQNERLFHDVGKRLGRDMWRQYRTAFRLGRRPVVKDMVQCIAGFEESWAWPCTILQQSEEQVSFNVPPLPFGSHASIGAGQRTIFTGITSGIFGGIAEEAFGYGKVCFVPADGSGRSHTHVVVYVQPTAESDAAPGLPSRKYLLDTSSPQYRFRGAGDELEQLSRRERQVLQCVGEGLSNKEVAAQLGISVRTVEGHVSRVCVKLDLRRRADLIRFSLRHKLATL